jgi:hypothetical protein
MKCLNKRYLDDILGAHMKISEVSASAAALTTKQLFFSGVSIKF